MRRDQIQTLAAEIDRADASKSLDTAMNFWVENFGPQCAGWLTWTHRRILRRSGVVDFKMPKNIDTPPWFRVAMETLKRRQNWAVIRTGSALSSEKVYRVRWLGWGTWKPESIGG
jgi:hypothetical protein